MLHRAFPDAETRFVAAGDGTLLAWHAHPGAPPGAPTVVLTNGLSTTEDFWRFLVARLAPRYRVVHWNYRGHAASERARSGDYGLAQHADDLGRVVDAAGGAPAPVLHVAFSMGVAVLLEHHRKSPDRIGAMALVAGGAGAPYASVLRRHPALRAAFAGGAGVGARLSPALGPVARRVGRSKVLFGLARATGAIGPRAPRADVERFFRAAGEMDMRAYFGSLRGLACADGSGELARVRTPALVVAPERDVMALRADLQALHAGIPDAEWQLYPGTGHAILLEAGDEVAARIDAFFVRAS